MIYITGDIHGSPERLGMHSFYEQKEMTRDDIVIICQGEDRPILSEDYIKNVLLPIVNKQK